MLKSMKWVDALSRLAKGNPHGCNVGIYERKVSAQAGTLFV